VSYICINWPSEHSMCAPWFLQKGFWIRLGNRSKALCDCYTVIKRFIRTHIYFYFYHGVESGMHMYGVVQRGRSTFVRVTLPIYFVI
jgi:hypothetical protein